MGMASLLNFYVKIHIVYYWDKTMVRAVARLHLTDYHYQISEKRTLPYTSYPVHNCLWFMCVILHY